MYHDRAQSIPIRTLAHTHTLSFKHTHAHTHIWLCMAVVIYYTNVVILSPPYASPRFSPFFFIPSVVKRLFYSKSALSCGFYWFALNKSLLRSWKQMIYCWCVWHANSKTKDFRAHRTKGERHEAKSRTGPRWDWGSRIFVRWISLYTKVLADFQCLSVNNCGVFKRSFGKQSFFCVSKMLTFLAIQDCHPTGEEWEMIRETSGGDQSDKMSF